MDGYHKFSPSDKKRGGPPLVVVLLVGGLLIAVLAGAFFLLRPSPPPGEGKQIAIEFSKPEQVLMGQPFTLGILLSNPTDLVLEEVGLTISLPEGISLVGQDVKQRAVEQLVGELGPGGVRQETVNLIATAGHQTLKRLSSKVRYKRAGSSARFEEFSYEDLVLGQPAIALTMNVPQEVVSGENFEIKLTYENASPQDFDDVELHIEYPSLFKFSRSSRAPDRANNEWTVGKLRRGEKGELSIYGRITGPELSYFGFNAILSSIFFNQRYTINNQVANTSIAASLIAVNVTLNGRSDYIARPGETLAYVINYRNNSDLTFENLVVKATLVGELFNFVTVEGEGFFSSLTNTFTWAVAGLPRLAILGPGQEDSVTLKVSLKDSFPLRRLGDKNYTVKIQAQVESPTVPIGRAAEKTVTVMNLENKVAGNFTVGALAFFRDAESGIVNSGPYPPRVNQPTRYTIHWRITTYAADFANVRVQSFLQFGARWTGQVKSNVETGPLYDSASGRVTWDIPKLPANKGAVPGSQPAEAVFQIELTPAVNQIGREVTFLSETVAQAQETFTNLTLSGTDGILTTGLPDDPTVKDAPREVQP